MACDIVKDLPFSPAFSPSRVSNSSITAAEKQGSTIEQAVARARPASGLSALVLVAENPPETGTEPLRGMFPEMAGRRRTNGEWQ